MTPFKYSLITLAVAGTLSLAGCGGGGSSSGGSDSTPTTRSVTGVITGFGSVFVGGVEYETDDANFTVDGASGLESDLEVGMVITLEGTVNPDGTTGTAVAIEYEEEVEGLVLANNVAVDGTLNVMGQTVHIDDQTNFESDVDTVMSFEDIAVNHYIEVSGFSSGSGEIYATHIEVKRASLEAGDELEVKGIVAAHDAGSLTFQIGELTIDYSTAMFEDFSEVSDGLYVEVESNQDLVDGVLIASEIELKDAADNDHDDIDELEFEGVITAINDDTSIVVNNMTVRVNDDTEFENGSLDNLLVGTKISVEGEFDSNGAFIAEEIELKSEADVELEGMLEDVDAENNTVTVMGQVIVVTNLTLMEDEADDDGQTPERYFSVSDLVIGDWVEIDAYFDETRDALVATALERDDADDSGHHSLEGKVEDNTVANQLTVSGITVDTSALEVLSVDIGAYVEIDGTFDSGVLSAVSIELDD